VPTNAGAFALSGAAKGRLLYQRRLSMIFSRCSRVQGCHGGLTPPALVLPCDRLSAKKRFLRCTNARSPKSGGRQPAVARRTERRTARIEHCPAVSEPATRRGGRQPAVARSYDRCAARNECCSATSEHTAKSGGRQPAVGVGNALAKALLQSRGRLPSVCSGTPVQSRPAVPQRADTCTSADFP
jgi:hypothetical protein